MPAASRLSAINALMAISLCVATVKASRACAAEDGAPDGAPAGGAAADIDSPDHWSAAQRELARLGEGQLVWESRRTGQWRIWTMRLDGGGLKQLSPDEAGRDHYCPKLSPDGKRLVYLSLSDEAQKDNQDRPRDVGGQLHLIGADGGDNRVLVEKAQKYNGWDRAVTWFDNQRLAYIDGEGNTWRLDITSGKQEPLIKGGQCWLPNTRLTHAVWSFNTFSLLNAERQTVTPMPHLGGCQPYFTHDGNWGFWVRAPGGPIYKMHLATRAIAPLFDRSLLPPHRNYCYFPMVSCDQRLLAFAAADMDKLVGEYGGYVNSDYEIFLLKLEPSTLEPTGKPVRYTFEKHCDRFPDVFQAEPALGYHSNKAPFEVRLTAPAGARWNYGDGASDAGQSGQHIYRQPGIYFVEAQTADRVLRGQVRVLEAAPPTITGAVVEDQRNVIVTFNEPVDLTDVKLSLGSGAKIEGFSGGDDGRSLRVKLAEKPAKSDRLAILGVSDRAQHPNRMPPSEVPVIARSWPSNPTGLVFFWQTAKEANLLRDPLSGQTAAYAPKAHNRAWFDRRSAMVLDGGAFSFDGLMDQFSNAVRKSNELSIELTLRPAASEEPTRPACVLTYGLSQAKGALWLNLNGVQTELCALPVGETSHVLVTYKLGKLKCYRNGVEVLVSNAVSGDLSGYPAGNFWVGNNLDNQSWRGTVEGIALYNRALTGDEAQINANAYRALRESAPAVQPLEVEARLIGVSKIPTLNEIKPYRQALIVNEYAVKRVVRGDYATPRIRVAHWAILDEVTQPIARLPIGEELRLLVEPLADQPQLEEQFTNNTLDEDFDLPLFYSVADDPKSYDIASWNVLPGVADGKNALDEIAGPEGRRRLPVSFVNLQSLPHAGNGRGYAVAYVKSPAACKALLEVGAVGGAKAWLNGREALGGQFGRYPFLGSRQTEVQLEAGWNEVLLKTTQLYAFWGFRCAVLTADGRALPGLGYAVEP